MSVNEIHEGDLVTFSYAQPGTGLVYRQGQVERLRRCKAGHWTLTIFDDDRRQFRQFKLHKVFNLRCLIPSVNTPFMGIY
jgi:predicted DNA-binding transcriptional regulator YafY